MHTLDKMQLIGVEVWAHHGVYPDERQNGQLFRVDATWWQDLSGAARTDNLADTVDYADVAAFIQDKLTQGAVDLIETVAARLLEALLTRYPVEYAAVTIHKPDAPLPIPVADVAFATAIAARDGAEGAAMVPVTAEPSPCHRDVVFSVGSNVGERLSYLQFAVDALASTPGIAVQQVSGVYETAPQSVGDQPDFLNAVLVARSGLPAPALLARALEIEALGGRTRLVDHGPRTLDIDLVAVGHEVWDDPALILPHPRAASRAFVLIPWLEADPAACLGTTAVAGLVSAVAGQRIHRVVGDLFLPGAVRVSASCLIS
jgi:dihydroneopterin aldolase/2-amino-4-hydroxy-6-hydroxymethyldihydropteridine diphosphokinase